MSRGELLSSPVAIGETIAGKYRVDRILTAGGMGIVVACTHEQLGHRVALKFLRDHLVDDLEIVERFLREARACVGLESSHVVRVLDVGVLESGAPYIVMELLTGRDLGEVLEQDGPFPVADAVDSVLQAADAIAEAHSLGIVHRDLKPANLFRVEHADGSWSIKVLDFGISKLKEAQTDGVESITRTAALMGTPRYMSPEQIRDASRVDQRCDVWALGIILYELLTGTVPFQGRDVAGQLAAIIADPPIPLLTVRSNVPTGLVEVVVRALQKDPEARIRSVRELTRKLNRFRSPATDAVVARILGRSSRPSVGRADTSGSNETFTETGAKSGLSVLTTKSRALLLGEAKSTERSMIGIGLLLIVAALALWLSSRPFDDPPGDERGDAADEAPANADAMQALVADSPETAQDAPREKEALPTAEDSASPPHNETTATREASSKSEPKAPPPSPRVAPLPRKPVVKPVVATQPVAKQPSPEPTPSNQPKADAVAPATDPLFGRK